MNFEFATANRIVFGCGVSAQAGQLARALGRRALVVTGSHPNRFESIFSSLRAASIASTQFTVAGEPEVGAVERGVELARESECDLIISAGGGSVLDAGKAIAAMLGNDGDLLDYLEVIGRGRKLENPSLPFIAIPTTAGTGSEVTRNAVLASPEHRVKSSLRSPHMLPAVALVDPDLTKSLPIAIAASTCLDALTQLIEPYVCNRANPMTDALCLEGMTRAARSLQAMCREDRTPEVREDMAIASLFGGLALANAGLGAVHGLAGPIGGMFPAPHGAVCAALLPHVMEINIEALRTRRNQSPALDRFAAVANVLTARHDAKAEEATDWVRDLLSSLHIQSLGSFGMQAKDVPEIVAKAKAASSMKANPIELYDEELQKILRRSL